MPSELGWVMGKKTGVKFSVDGLSEDQFLVYNEVRKWVKGRRDPCNKKILTVGGYAGTGKSTLLGVLAGDFKKDGLLVAYVSYTGRASSVLHRKLKESGVETTTLLRPVTNEAYGGRESLYDPRLSIHDK